MNPVVLFRDTLAEEGELAVCHRHFHTYRSRMEIPRESLVVCRYSALPFYQEMETDIRLLDSRMINTWREHQFIADVMQWGSVGGVLEGLTPRSWSEWGSLPEGAYVLKGRTNSRKHQWATHMFAPNKAALPGIARRLFDDSMLNEQGLVCRQYVPLRRLGEGLNGLPISNEWRTFWVCDEHRRPWLLGKGFYWASHPELAPQATWSEAADALAVKAAWKVADYATFFVLDLAETESGEWIVVEVNDGQQAGLSGVDPEALYSNLSQILRPQ